MILDQIIYDSENRVFSSVGVREFGLKSKLLGAALPGAWHAKEAAKFGYDNEEDYKKVRGKYALKGALTPLTATIVHYKAADMAAKGKSSKEIRKYLENPGSHRLGAGIVEAATGSLGGFGSGVGTVAGIHSAILDPSTRKKFKK